MTHDISRPLLNTAAEFVSLQNVQDIQGMLRLMYKESFAYRQTEQVFLKLFAAFELQTTVLGNVFVTSDADYAYVRLKLKTVKIAGPDFKNDITEFLVVFRNMDKVWKIWWQLPLTFQLL